MRAAVLALIALAAVAGDAAAQPSRPFQLEVTGVKRYGGHGDTGDLRVLVGYAHHLRRSPHRSLFFAAGLEGTIGELQFDDPRGIDGELGATRKAIGLSLRAGYAWAWWHSWPQIYTFAGVTPIVAHTATDSPLVAEAGGAVGGRMSLGIAFPGSFEAMFKASTEGEDDEQLAGILILWLPNTLEVSYEELHAGGEVVRRGGFGIGWSL